MRTVLCADALAWLQAADIVVDDTAIVTSLPDAHEVDQAMDYLGWRAFFLEAVHRCVAAIGPEMPAIFLQTDRRIDGRTECKLRLVAQGAENMGAHLVWEKIVLRRDAGKVDLFRPTYSHLIAVSVRARPGRMTEDVLSPSPSLYANGTPWAAARTAVDYAADCGATTILDPFCGYGTILAAADERGLESLGVDIDPEMAERARALATQEVLPTT